MDLRRLEVFASVVKHGNFSRAAHALYLTQPTVSSHIDLLEKSLGVALFERQHRRAVLTSAGRVFYPYAISALRTVEEGQKSVQRFQQDISGMVTIAASSTPGIYLLPRFLDSFLQLYPDVRFDIMLVNSVQVVEKLLNYEADMGLVGLSSSNTLLTRYPMAQDELVLIVSAKQGQFVQGQPCSLKELLRHKLVLRQPGSATRQTFAQALEKKGIKIADLNVSIEIDSMAGVINCVRAQLGVAVVSRMAVEGVTDIVWLPIEGLDLKRQFYILLHKQRVLTPAGERLSQFLIEGVHHNA